MAIPSSIPTSFVPKQPVEMHQRRSGSGGIFMALSLVVLGIAVVLAAGVFVYSRYLSAQAAGKEAEIQKAQQGVSQDSVEQYIRLSERLSSAKMILSGHVMLSQFFDALESLTLADVQITSLSVETAADGGTAVKMTGVAKNFNALAAQSAAFAKEPRIKQAIFSGISANKSGVVSFSVSAKLDSRLTSAPSGLPSGWSIQAPEEEPAPIAPATATTTAPATTTQQNATSTP